MMGFSVQRGSRSYRLLDEAQEVVLAVPGESMAAETLFFGIESGDEKDKIDVAGVELVESKTVAVPGIENAIANIELSLINVFDAGDHKFVLGRVQAFAVRKKSTELPLLSIGPRTNGYRLLARHGVHRIAVVASEVRDPPYPKKTDDRE
jgi:flavin reductase (DIM6/NTAB) family NADH-FMN oxidoreductase RutF